MERFSVHIIYSIKVPRLVGCWNAVVLPAILLLGLSFAITASGEAKPENIRVVTIPDAATKQPYFQLSGFPADSTDSRLDPSTSNFKKALYGLSMATFSDASGRYFMAGAPRSSGRGEVHQCQYVDEKPDKPVFRCSQLNFVTPKHPNATEFRIFLGSSVSALSNRNGGIMLYCGHLYRLEKLVKGKSVLISSGLCNLQARGRRAPPIIMDPCVDSSFSCLAGFSSSIMNSIRDKKKFLVGIGAPGMGSSAGRGLVAAVPFGDFNKDDPKVTFTSTEHQKLDDKTFYRGYSIDFGEDNADLGTEEALFLTTPIDYTLPRVPRVEQYIKMKLGSNPTGVLSKYDSFTDKAEHLGGFYGFSLVALKLTPVHKESSLLVGEPFFSDLKQNLIDVGRVYIYCDLESQRAPLVLRGEKPNSLFGFSIAQIGDTNGDGITDFAVGCPYCDDGYGVVYIFLGANACQIGQPVDVIRGREVSRIKGPLQGFGWSLAGGEDFDQNGYPDLVIGTPLSNSVVLARSRSLLKFQCTIVGNCTMMVETVSKKTCRDFKSNSNQGCQCPKHFRIDVTFMYQKNVELRDLKFNVTIDLDADKTESGTKRVFDGPGGKPIITLEMPLIGFQKNASVTFWPMINSDKFRADMDTPIRFEARLALADPNVATKDRKGRLMPSPRVISLSGHPCDVNIDILYYDCGIEPCKADMSLRLISESTDRLQPSSSVNAFQVTRPVDYPLKNQTIGLMISNAGGEQDAIRPRLELNLRNGLRFIKTTQTTYGVPECSVLGGETRVICDFKKNSYIAEGLFVGIHVDLSSVYDIGGRPVRSRGSRQPLGPPQLEAIVKTASRDMNSSNDRVIVNYAIVYRPTIKLVSGESEQTVVDDRNTAINIRPEARVYVDQVGPKLRHVYQLSNSGPSPAQDIVVNISVPVASENGEYILYIFDEMRTLAGAGGRRKLKATNVAPRVISESGRSVGLCVVPSAFRNPRRITVIETHGEHVRGIVDNSGADGNASAESAPPSRHVRVRRDATDTAQIVEPIGTHRRAREIVHCGEDSVHLGRPRCADIECRIDRLAVGDAVRIVFDGWLWARTVVGRRISDIEVKTSGRGYVAGVPAGISEKGALEFEPMNISTNFIFRRIKTSFPIWPIFAGAFLGLLALGGLVVVLYKCGFFERQRPSQVAPQDQAASLRNPMSSLDHPPKATQNMGSNRPVTANETTRFDLPSKEHKE